MVPCVLGGKGMKLQRQFAYSYKGKKHYKNVIVIPDEVVLKLGWKAGQELEVEVDNDKLIVRVTQVETS